LALRAAVAAGLSVAWARLCRFEFPIYAPIAAVIVTDLSPSRTSKLGLQRIVATVVGGSVWCRAPSGISAQRVGDRPGHFGRHVDMPYLASERRRQSCRLHLWDRCGCARNASMVLGGPSFYRDRPRDWHGLADSFVPRQFRSTKRTPQANELTRWFQRNEERFE